MDYTTLGSSGLEVSRVALGCMSYGTSAWRPWVLEEGDARPFFRRAIEGGINFFDTADMYSLGVSEEVAGRALAEYGVREELVIASKVYFPMGDGPNRGGLSRKHIVEACEASLRRLGVEAIDLYQIHRFDADTPLEETLAALDHLVTSGKVRYIGASSGWAWQMARALGQADRHGWSRFVSMQNHYNLIYREEEREMLPLCEAEGVGVIPWSPLARGHLARPVAEYRRPVTARAENDEYGKKLYDGPGDRAIIEAVESVAEARGVSMAEVSLAWLLSKPGIAAPIIGATKLDHLDAALRSVEMELTDDEVERLEGPYEPHRVMGHA